MILAEGIVGNSLVAGALTSADRLPARRDRLGLVAQNIDYARLQAEVIAPDLTGRQLRSGCPGLDAPVPRRPGRTAGGGPRSGPGPDQPADIAVVYGAAHMPALIRHLQSRYGFRPRAADWLTVFDF